MQCAVPCLLSRRRRRRCCLGGLHAAACLHAPCALHLHASPRPASTVLHRSYALPKMYRKVYYSVSVRG